MEQLKSYFENYLTWLRVPQINLVDIVEIIILAFCVYHIIVWIKDTRAWVLLKGVIVIVLVWVVAVVFNMDVLLWLYRNVMILGLTALVVIFQPEFRNALEQIGRRSFASLTPGTEKDDKKRRYSRKSLEAISTATFAMAKVKTGALIVVEQEIQCRDQEVSGIPLDSEISSQLLINIFEHNTPLHDGAVILRENRIVAATCYLPLSNNFKVSKELGTRHRAALGISEVSDSLTIVVSEETGYVSVAKEGVLERNITKNRLDQMLHMVAKRTVSISDQKWWKKDR